MTTSLNHRGPDAEGLYFNPSGNVGLGHRRLSIIDLSSSANQPFVSANGRFIIVFNGEVYNFPKLRTELRSVGVSFRTTSDTEVIVEAYGVWGPAVATKLEGMFAMAIYDTLDNTFLLLRDRLGKKPLYYYRDETMFAFASELKSLLANPHIASTISINTGAISHFLHLGYIPGKQTIYNEIHEFPTGCYGRIDQQLHLNVKTYWQISDVDLTPKRWTIESGKAEFNRIFRESVEKRLVSDVPLGVFLSGGVDSSLVTAITAALKKNSVKTFSIGFHESKFDESNYAKEIAAHFGTDHTKFILPEKQAAEILNTYLDYFDEPFADTSSIPTMIVSELARKDVTVALTGDGGDELFMGYGSYRWAERLNSTFWKAGKRIIPFALNATGKSRLKRIAQMVDTPADNIRSHIFSQEQYFFTQREIAEDVLKDHESFRPFIYDESFTNTFNLSAGEKQALFDLQFYLRDDLLTKVDRSSMYFGLECRCPLLDDKVVEFALTLPNSFKVRNNVQKWFLKEVLCDYLPRKVVNRPKWGFSIPLGKWMKGELSYLMDYLSEEQLQKVGLFDVTYVRKLVERFRNGDDYLYNRLWVLIIMQRFMLHHGR